MSIEAGVGVKAEVVDEMEVEAVAVDALVIPVRTSLSVRMVVFCVDLRTTGGLSAQTYRRPSRLWGR